MTLRTVFIGTGAFGVPALRAVAGSPEFDLVGVVTAPARPAGRRGEPRFSPIAEVAGELGVGVVQAPLRLRHPQAIGEVLRLRPDLVVVADYGQIVPQALLAVRFGALNLHPSVLPRHRGASPVAATILAGDRRTGVTLMRMDEGLDTGPIVAVADVALHGTETRPMLETFLAVLGADLLMQSLGLWVRGQLAARPQPADGATITRPLHRGDGRLDPARPATTLARQVRAFQPWPGSWFQVLVGRFTVWQVEVVPAPADEGQGELRSDGGRLLLATQDGALDLIEVQPAGGRRMSGQELLRGRPALLHERVDSPAGDLAHGPIERPVGYSSPP